MQIFSRKSDALRPAAECITLQELALKSAGRFSGTAVECEGRCVSFREFDAVSERISLALAALGAGPGKTVQITMQRSERMLMALFGIFKTGAAVLPVSPETPELRADKIRSAICPDVILDEELYSSFLRSEPGQEEKTAARRTASPDDDALIIFTSGSTGNPKGVRHSQRSAAAYAYVFPEEVPNLQGKNCSAVVARASCMFIASYAFEYWVAPFRGMKTVLLSEKEQNSPEAVGKALKNNEGAMLYLNPSLAENFLAEPEFRESFGKAGIITLAAEPLTDSARETILRYAGNDAALIDIYGSSECMMITCRNIRDEGSAANAFPGAETVCLGADRKICPAGEAGEVAVYSPYVFADYIGAKVRKTEICGKNYCLTGDLGVMTENGQLRLRGRIDRMIKYHGQRIELADIENNLRLCPGILETAVVPARTKAGMEILCAYYSGNPDCSSANLRSFLAERLPVYMIPAGFVRMEALPRNSNGKIDFPLLGKIIYDPSASSYSAYKTDAAGDERIALLSRIIAGILGRKPAADDNLFALGLDSLTGYRIVGALAREGYAADISLLFEYPTVSALAGVIRRTEKETEEGNPAEQPYPERKYPATGIQIYWGTDIDETKKHTGLYTQETFVTGAVFSEDSFAERVRRIVRRHPAMRSEIVFDGEMPVQIISDEADGIACYYEDLRESGLEDAEVFPTETQLGRIRQHGFEILQEAMEKDPPVRFLAQYYRTGETAGVISYVINHFCMDGMSLIVLDGELTADSLPLEEDGYRAYLDYIGRTENLAEAGRFWGDYLRNAEPSALPKPESEDSEKPAFDPMRFRTFPILPGEEDSACFTKACAEENVPAVSYVMYAYGKALMKVLEKDALIFQILTFGRGIPVDGTENTVGCMIEYVPVVIRKDDSPRDFHRGCLMAEKYSFLPLPMIWKAAGYEEPPELAPFLLSEVFPPVKTEKYYQKLDRPDYGRMVMSNFVAMNGDALELWFHCDPLAVQVPVFEKLTQEIRKLLEEQAEKFAGYPLFQQDMKYNRREKVPEGEYHA